MRPRIILFTLPLLLLASELSAQWISIRTVPVIASNQSEFQPSLARGMGNLSIAFDDPLGDPFINPAKASRLNGIRLTQRRNGSTIVSARSFTPSITHSISTIILHAVHVKRTTTGLRRHSAAA